MQSMRHCQQEALKTKGLRQIFLCLFTFVIGQQEALKTKGLRRGASHV